jgi:D-alanine-D-alanine ligase
VKSFEYVYDQLRANAPRKIDLENVYYVRTDGLVVVSRACLDKPAEYYYQRPMEDAASLESCFSELGGGEEFLFSILVGQNGEDGRVSALAEQCGVRGSFDDVLACGLAMSKVHMNSFVAGLGLGLRIPRTVCARSAREAESVFDAWTHTEAIVKPNSLGASLFTERLATDSEGRKALGELVARIFRFDHRALVQEYIPGNEYTCGCLRRLEDVITLPVMQIIPGPGQFYGHRQKHDASAGTTETFLDSEGPLSARIQQVSRAIFDAAGFEHMCRVDFVADSSGELYFLEVNPIPGLMPRSLYPHMLQHAGLGIDDLILQTVENGRSRRRLETTYRYDID